jgi:hypothetical protein
MDLLTRGAGFGYIGSTITSLIYASFTFIFFALEAAVMAYALELALNIPPSWGYLICALVVIPLVTHGVSVISRPAGLDAAAVAGDAGRALCRMCLCAILVHLRAVTHYKGISRRDPGLICTCLVPH